MGLVLGLGLGLVLGLGLGLVLGLGLGLGLERTRLGVLGDGSLQDYDCNRAQKDLDEDDRVADLLCVLLMRIVQLQVLPNDLARLWRAPHLHRKICNPCAHKWFRSALELDWIASLLVGWGGPNSFWEESTQRVESSKETEDHRVEARLDTGEEDAVGSGDNVGIKKGDASIPVCLESKHDEGVT